MDIIQQIKERDEELKIKDNIQHFCENENKFQIYDLDIFEIKNNYPQNNEITTLFPELLKFFSNHIGNYYFENPNVLFLC